MNLHIFKSSLGKAIRGYKDGGGYEPIPDDDNPARDSEDINRRDHIRPLYVAQSSSGILQNDGRSTSPKRFLRLSGLSIVIAGAAVLVLSFLIFWQRFAAMKSTSTFIVPGDAAWLCQQGDGHSNSLEQDVCAPGDGTPDYESYFPIVYVVLGDDGAAIARAIVNNTTPCPLIEFKDGIGNVNGDVRKQHEIPTVTERAVGNNDLPFAFPVRVCEAIIKERGWTSNAYFGDKKLPLVPEDPSRFVVLGDTGLRSKPENLGIGTCLDGPLMYGIHQCLKNFTRNDVNSSEFAGHFQSLDKWPLGTLMKRAVQEKPDILIHMGDFVYRQGPCPHPNINNATCSGINLPPRFSYSGSSEEDMIMNFVPGLYGDTFWSWWADFFYPSLEALGEVPWIALRGNHESCSRAGRGWFLFLSPQPYDSEAVAGAYCRDHTEPWKISFLREQFLLVDDSTIEPKDRGFDGLQFIPGDCPTKSGTDLQVPELMNRFLATNPEQDCENIYDELDIFTQHFLKVEEMSKSYETNFYLGHRPIFGIACNDTKLLSMDWTLQCSLGCTTLDRVSALFSGHMHWRESITFQDSRLPPQIIAGHGGTDLVSNYIIDRSLDGLRLELGKDLIISVTIDEGEPDSSAFGYAVMERTASMNYDIVFRGLNMTTGTMMNVGTPLTIPKGPRVKGKTQCQKKKDTSACSPPAGHRCSR
mmetsp:Transcript_20787/g.42434  ORF Transcript_20787/g.42434 Transcript_20787/m.42434 type:complete len:697 (+) Transcript_20787:2007-4097(+)